MTPPRTDRAADDRPVETPGLQSALARLLTDERLLERLGGADAREIQDRFGLTDQEFATIIAIPRKNLGRYARSLRIRRLWLLGTMLPVTVEVVIAHRGTLRVAREFGAAYPRDAAAEGEDFRERNIEWFTDYVLTLPRDQIPPWLPDLARYEAVRSLLACGRAAHEAVYQSTGDALDDDALLRARPRLPANVALAEFDHDVLALLPVASADPTRAHEPRRTYVLSQRLRNWQVNSFRLSASAYRVLRHCTGAETLAAVAARDDDPQRVLEFVRRANRQGIVSFGPVAA